MSENEINATERCDCENCGANMVFDPETGKLYCPFCESTRSIRVKKAPAEREYERFLNTDEEWGSETHMFRCESCGGETVFTGNATSQVCSFCGASNIIKLEEHKGVHPDSILPFSISKNKAKELYTKYIKKKFYAKKDFKTAQTAENITGMYIPSWIFDCDTESTYTAEGGEYYYVTETYTVTVNGKQETRTRQVRHTRWYPVSGNYDRRFDNINVPAGAANVRTLMDKVAPYNLNQLYAYTQEFISGFGAEHYSVDLRNGFDDCKIRAGSVLQSEIRREILRNYDEVRFLNVSTQYDNVQFNHSLLPLWLLAKKYKNKTYNFAINGQTGKTTGNYPKSVVKIVLTVLLCVAILALIVWLIAKEQ